ncbi:lipopolysaccharide heptosyltransferase II [Candidatus Woesearchaeota archaeon]|nr:lipopolysaccharide heptosyltransferase II [Candidatus Woesearchaeota archaeon]|tara:strand:- start:6014 stop:7120 length:1107 start_codon:yes stop_codon:yes gene_type:complete
MGKFINFIGNKLFSSKAKQLPEEVNNILIIRSGGIGDVLMTTPLATAIRGKYPDSKIYYLTGNWSKEALEGNKNINDIITFDDEIIFKKKLFKVFSLIKSLRKRKYELCFVLDKSWQWSLLAFLAGAKFRIGFNRNKEGFANNLNVPYDGSKYELDYYLGIAEMLGIKIIDKDMLLSLSEEDLKSADDFCLNNNLKHKTLIGIAAGGAENPGQKMHIKRWSKEKYIALIKRILEKKKDAVVLLFGGENDLKLNDYILNETDKIRVYNLVGKATIKQSAALIKKCKAFVTHDSGTMHIASITKVPLIALFGPTDPNRFAPKNAIIMRNEVKCSHCYDIYGRYNEECKDTKCMNIAVKDVYEKVNSILTA